MYKVKKFSSIKENKTQRKKNRKDLVTSIGGLTTLAGAVGATSYDTYKTNKETNRLSDMYNRARKKDESIYNNTNRRINEANELKSKSKGLGDDIKINRGRLNAELQNINNDSFRFQSSNRARVRGENLIKKASNKRLAIGLGLSAAAGLGAAYGINKAAKNRIRKVNESRSNK